MAESYTYDIIKTLVLTAVGYYLYKGVNRFYQLRNEPIVIGDKNSSSYVTIDIPTLWIPYNPGDTKDSVTAKYRPNISIEGSNWLLQFNKLTSTVHGLKINYTPKPIKIPIVPTLSQAEMLVRLVPKVESTIAPVGWNITFPKFILLN